MPARIRVRSRRKELHMTDISRTAHGRNSELRFHPLADIFPLMEGEEFDELVADIKANGLHDPIVMYEGKILDGRNRYRAAIKAGVDPFPLMKNGKRYGGLNYVGDDPAGFVISRNIHRRHLTAEQKRDVIAKLIAAAPEKSNRQVAKAAGVSHPHVAKVRAEMEEAGDVETVSTSIDTRGRKQPAKKGWSRERYKAHRARKKTATSAANGEAAPLAPPANYYINKLLEFECSYANEFRAWLPKAELSAGDREALIERLQSCAKDLVLLSQEVAAPDGNGNDPGPIPACLVRAARDGAP
jgi:hypothetical protein